MIEKRTLFQNVGKMDELVLFYCSWIVKKICTKKTGREKAVINDCKATTKTTECAICLENEVKIVLRPCGHVTCFTCSNMITDCHLCRTFVKNKVHVFL